MKKKNLIACIHMLVLAIAIISTQEGVAQEEEFVLGRNERTADVDAAIVVQGGVAFAGKDIMPTFGVGFNQRAFGNFRLGGNVAIAATPEKTLPSLDVEATYRFGGNALYLEMGVVGGVGAVAHSITEENEWFLYKRNRLVLSPEVGAKIGVGYNFGRMALGILGEYKCSLNTKELQPEEGFEVTSRSLTANPLTIWLRASYRITAEGVHRNGDNPWRGGVAIALGKTPSASVELNKVERHAYHWVNVIGAEFRQTLNGPDRTSGVVRFGEQYLAKGATTWLIPEVLVQAGMTEVLSEVETHVTGDAGAELWRGNRVCRPAIEVGGEARLNLRLSGVTLFGAVEVAYAIPFHGNNAGGDIDNASYEVINPLSVYAKVGCMFTL